MKNDTPIFTVIEPVAIPLEKSKPIRTKIVQLWFLSGIVVSVLVVISGPFRSYFYKLLK